MSEAPTVTRDDLVKGFEALGIDGGVEVHSSLSAFGYVPGGAETVADAMLRSFPLVMVPTFTWGNGEQPPEGSRIERNGIRPDKMRRWAGRRVEAYDRQTSPSCVGAITEAVRKRPGTVRSIHPTHSFAANGRDAERMVAAQTYENPMAPIEVMLEAGGWVLMLGTELTSCTPIHAAEHLAGRQFFIRWALVADGTKPRIRTPGCSKGFKKFEPILAPIVREVKIGNSRVRAYPGREFLRLAVEAIKRDPEITMCSRDCVVCRDSLAGGPIEPADDGQALR